MDRFGKYYSWGSGDLTIETTTVHEDSEALRLAVAFRAFLVPGKSFVERRHTKFALLPVEAPRPSLGGRCGGNTHRLAKYFKCVLL